LGQWSSDRSIFPSSTAKRIEVDKNDKREINEKLIPSGQGFRKVISSRLKEPRQGAETIGDAKHNSMITIEEPFA
jgi:hypothetical protein